MSCVDLVLLGFLQDAPAGAYEIQKMIEFRNLSNWVRVSAPSVYKKLLVLESKGFISGKSVREGNMPEKTVYSITRAGKEYFASLMIETSSMPVSVLFDFNAVVANLAKLSRHDAGVCLSGIRKGVGTGRSFVVEHVPRRKDIPIEGQSIMQQQLKVYDALLEWLDEYEGQLAGKKRR
jgi:Predicted transcriptional regulators